MSRNAGFGQSQAGAAYQKLIYNIFQSTRNTDHGFAIGLVSPEPGAGTTSLTRKFAEELSAGANRVLEVDLGYIARTAQSVEDLLGRIRETAGAYSFALRGEPNTGTPKETSAFWNGNIDHRRNCVRALRDRFDYVLFDCPALQHSGDALGIASALDGFLLVIEANRTTAQAIQLAEESLQNAGAKLYGSILNKQQSAVPNWAQRFLGDPHA